MIAASSTWRAILREARRYAACDATVLITGETGVGKDVLARYIHASGPRHDQPFVTIDCPALPSTLAESELFGHEPGAYTDAHISRPGRFELAGAGTLYLDAVSGLTPTAQGALLRVLEERRVTRLGGTVAREIRSRFVASADAALEEQIASGGFRSELYHRLRVLPIRVPALRERRTEILPLARHVLAQYAAAMRRPRSVLGKSSEDVFVRYRWPGNIRQLRYVIERLMLLTPDSPIDVQRLPTELLDDCETDFTMTDRRRPTLAELERRYIEQTLHLTRGHQTQAAAILGISRKALWEKRKRFGLDGPLPTRS